MNNNIDIIDAYDIQHLPDSRGNLNSPGSPATGAQMSQPDFPVFDQRGTLEMVAGMSIFLNIILGILLAISYIAG